MTNAFCALAVGEFAMQADPLPRCKFALLQLELGSEIEQAHLALLLGEDLVKECQVIAEEDDRTRIIHWRVASNELVSDRTTKEPLPKKICEEIFQDGLHRGLLAMSYTHAIRLQPALTIDRETALSGLSLLREAIEAVSRRHGAG